MPLKVLVVEDQPAVRNLLAMILESAGFVVETAIDGADGFEKFQHGAFDVVVTDEIMPRMSGLALGRACRMLAPHVPVLLVTGSDLMPTAQELDSCGIRQVLAKPFTPETLLQAVDRAERG